MCGRIETKKHDSQQIQADGSSKLVKEEWSSDGQCVVVHSQLLITAAHVCFYQLDANDVQPTKSARGASSSTAPSPASAAAAPRSDSRHSNEYASFPFIRAVFVEPQMNGGRVVGRVQHIFECELLRYSDSMDAAILRIKQPLSNVPLRPFPRLMRAEDVIPSRTVALIAFKSPLAFTPHEIPGVVLYVEERTKKHGSGGDFTIGETDYLVQGGFSGGAVVHLAADGVWELVGVHTGTDFTRYGDAAIRAEQGKRRRGGRPVTAAAAASASASSRRTSHSASSKTSDGTVSYDPSDEDGPFEVPNEETGDALMHAQTHSARATFFVAECVLSREHWAIPYVLTLPASAADGTDSSPPRSGIGGTSARRRALVSSGRLDSQLISTIAEELAECDVHA